MKFYKYKMTCMFGMDYRSLALFRVAMALCIIGDLIERATDLRVMYTDYGVFPRHLITERYMSNYFFVIHLMNTSFHFQAFLFTLHGVFAFLMLIGYRTRTMAALSWFMTISLQAYNGIVGHGGDVFFRMMLFINIFLPSSEFFSVDKATFFNDYHLTKQINHYNPNSYRVVSFATVAILLQMGLMYVTSYFYKTGEEWHNGESTFYALTLDYFATDIAKVFLNFRGTLRVLTLAVAKWELFGIFFMVSPIFTDWLRLFGAIGFIAMHAGFIMCLRLGFFFFCTAGAQLINIPTPAWELFFDWAEKKILKGQKPTRVYYNTSSPLSQRIALALKTFFIIPGTAVFSPLDSYNNQEISMDSYSVNTANTNNNDNSIYSLSSPPHQQLNEDTTTVYKSKELLGDDWLVTIDSNGLRKRNCHALNFIISKSPLLFPFAMLFNKVPQNVIDAFSYVMQRLHGNTQQKQMLSGKKSLYQKKRNPAPPASNFSKVSINLWMGFVCWFILAYNCKVFNINLGYHHDYNQIAYLFRFDQSWNMFSPAPPKVHWWHVIHGKLDDGTDVELFKDEGLFKFDINTVVNFDKPNPFYKSYRNHRWFKYWENGFNQANSDPLRLEMGRYICREFNSKNFNEKKLYTFSIYFVHEFQHLNGTVSPSQHYSLWNHICYDKPEKK
ncbi:hypothetical protein DICPUDRAFT_59115 [Dictyostelium purpureum]|uniref:HTTM-like domain-containing protein n=1 Tax=Dictyostelium purpureum TaxID=5786 RepID=F1A4F6_DICPU|nr:uncharacterized protein DICPUDRAFT_59115 [Dictyostelium purpureum]EGC28926.1 hypothetical protein DICPUDRAFT_59115 [Dictyostelium purpureum]|eukprot:XP_003294551.1 hypothetical protein DICPUDRAFT_59115 [Dictyostelium purpureum]